MPSIREEVFGEGIRGENRPGKCTACPQIVKAPHKSKGEVFQASERLLTVTRIQCVEGTAKTEVFCACIGSTGGLANRTTQH
jgi:hypothetical protein